MPVDGETRQLDTELMAMAKTIVTGLDATIRRPPKGALCCGSLRNALPRLDVTNDGTGDFHVVKTIGSGGMGYVSLARQHALERDVALKMVNPDETDPALDERLVSEGVVTGQLEHPNIVPVHMLGNNGAGRPVIVMKHVEGVPWSRLGELERGDADGDTVADEQRRHLEIFVQVCNAVSYSHAQGYVHRDIKPDNVMIGPFGEVYLLDWGIATRVGSPAFPEHAEDVVPMPMGTPTYLAPEMVQTDGIIDERTDVYLLGATLHRILTGRRRHEGSNLYEILASALASDPHDYGGEIPEELAAICNRATARSPEHRFQSVVELRDAITGYLRHKASLDLTAAAEELLAAFEAPRDSMDAAEHRAQFAECRFAFRHALREWPGNPRAREGLRRSLERMIAIDLDHGHLDAAESLLVELGSPSSELEGRLALAREARAAEEARIHALHELAFQEDPEVAGADRGMLALALALVAVGALVSWLMGWSPRDVHTRALLMMPPIILVLAGIVYRWRATMLSNQASRRLVAIVAITTLALTIHRGIGFFARPDFRFQLIGDLLVLATGGACLAVFAYRRVLLSSAVWTTGAIALAIYPGEPLHVFGPCSVLGIAILAHAWWRRRQASSSSAPRAPSDDISHEPPRQ
ncbi:MAG TPA: serine/threonine protein kinase [Polyangiaceae bacterium]|nr:serine/threonine protein kinase [Polyangiaceae bacterium]